MSCFGYWSGYIWLTASSIQTWFRIIQEWLTFFNTCISWSSIISKNYPETVIWTYHMIGHHRVCWIPHCFSTTLQYVRKLTTNKTPEVQRCGILIFFPFQCSDSGSNVKRKTESRGLDISNLAVILGSHCVGGNVFVCSSHSNLTP